MADPLVSVVVSTFERPDRLARLLTALRAQTLDRDAYEVVIVDNGSGPATEAVLAEERRLAALPLRTVRHERTLGPSGGRNSGWRAAHAPLIAFTDDDCRPTPSWLAELLAVAGEHPRAFVQGRTTPDPEDPVPRVDVLMHTRSIDTLGPQYETCNIAYPRELLEELGGFEESFGLRPAGEDSDLAWRALGSGRRAVFAPDAIVHHAVIELTPLGALRDAARWGNCARLFARHPGAREMLYRRIFWNVWHYLLVRSVAALLAPRWLRRLVLHRHGMALAQRARSSGGGLAWTGFLLLFDAVETASMLRGAARHRTVLL